VSKVACRAASVVSMSANDSVSSEEISILELLIKIPNEGVVVYNFWSLTCTPILSGFNSDLLHNDYVEKLYVILIVIRPSDGDVKPGGPLGAFRQE